MSGFESYLERIFQDHCPYLGRARAAGALRIWDYSDAPLLRAEELPPLGCFHTELLRRDRSSAANATTGLLCCAVLVLPNCPGLRHALGQTHFILKRIYTTRGLLFGKFWPGQALIGETGRPVADPPQPILVLRSSLPRRDLRFFEKKSRPFRNDYLTARDDGTPNSTGLRIPPAALAQRLVSLRPDTPAADRVSLARALYALAPLLQLLEPAQ